MDVKHAKDIARQWVNDESKKVPGFFGAYFGGSINWMPDNAAFPPTSDVDVLVVYEGLNPPGELHKFPYRGIVLDLDYRPSEQFRSPNTILSNYFTAGHFTTSNIITDPSGQLTKIHEAVSKDYAKREWVYKRCEQARDLTLSGLQWLDESQPFYDQVFSWLFAASIPTHMLLVAGLKNPTVKKCFVAAREVLARYEHMEIYDPMLGILGSTKMSRVQAELHLNSFIEVYDTAKELIKTPFLFSTEISEYVRPSIIEGSKNLIEQDYHREAMFWIAVVYSFCQKALYNDAPIEVQNKYTPAYMQLLSDLGIHSFTDLKKRNKQNEDNLPAVWRVAEAIIAVTTEM